MSEKSTQASSVEKGVGIVVAKPEKAIMALVRVLEAMGVERVEMVVWFLSFCTNFFTACLF